MKQIWLSVWVMCLVVRGPSAWACEKIAMPAVASLSRADIYIIRAQDPPAGTLILCPGSNGSGEEMVDSPEWGNFARKQKLNLVGLSFASNDASPDRGYFRAGMGSGDVLLDGLGRAFGSGQGPLLLYGFSRGAQFAYSFARWNPDRVLAWCADSATEWESPDQNAEGPRGIIACGDEDEPNYSAAVVQFLRGRGMRKPWTWVSLPHTGHSRSVALEAFARAYFVAVLANPGAKGIWLDVNTKSSPAIADLEAHPTLAAWLPDEGMAELWKSLHQP